MQLAAFIRLVQGCNGAPMHPSRNPLIFVPPAPSQTFQRNERKNCSPDELLGEANLGTRFGRSYKASVREGYDLEALSTTHFLTNPNHLRSSGVIEIDIDDN
ncbi:hypothetical protein ZHAS_00010874 [Anopheles sinensis]|uniref:Uncharacterized protein n=1 Tax=Anopheles sinensis TaxID=74873 RepID=A0A084VYF2_ANOSI|nr:hypothetical protein ZHAS_00010874 [Anopheles sinensis]